MRFNSYVRAKYAFIGLVSIGFCGANTVFAADIISIQGSSTVSSRLILPFKEQIEAISGQKMDVSSSKSAAGLVALFQGKAQIAMTSASVSKDMKAVREVIPTADDNNLKSFEIGKTRVSFVVNPSNPVRSLTLDQVRDILSHKIKNWNEIGGADVPIRVVAVRLGGGVTATVEGQVTGGKAIDVPNMIKVNNGSQVLKVVEQEVGAFGLAQSGLVAAAKLPEIKVGEDIEQTLFMVTMGEPPANLKSIIEAARTVASKELN